MIMLTHLTEVLGQQEKKKAFKSLLVSTSLMDLQAFSFVFLNVHPTWVQHYNTV